MEKNDGGPAFPTQGVQPDGKGGMMLAEGGFGMSLRDHFAGLAMQAMLGRKKATIDIAGDYPYQERAKLAYMIADAMILARSTP